MSVVSSVSLFIGGVVSGFVAGTIEVYCCCSRARQHDRQHPCIPHAHGPPGEMPVYEDIETANREKERAKQDLVLKQHQEELPYTRENASYVQHRSLQQEGLSFSDNVAYASSQELVERVVEEMEEERELSQNDGEAHIYW